LELEKQKVEVDIQEKQGKWVRKSFYRLYYLLGMTTKRNTAGVTTTGTRGLEDLETVFINGEKRNIKP
jgi:hypothetical protein